MKRILSLAAELGLNPDDLEPYGHSIAKVPLSKFPTPNPTTPLVVVTAMTPTPAGEGKTTTAIGLVDGLARRGTRGILTIREPSLGPVLGSKGAGSGGGKSILEPQVAINMHFTGDAHAVGSAHNFLAGMADAAVYNRTLPGLTAEGLTWRRVTDAEDRGLRHLIHGVGGELSGRLRETGFDIIAASEIMAILALCTGYDDLRARLSRLVVGYTRDDKPVTAADLGAVGAMMALLRDAIKPNLVQTGEGNPVIIHAGPFGNIAHGCSSILADRLALGCAEMVVTEAGFGADLGFEKFMDIKVRSGGTPPRAAVVVATLRAIKWHGGLRPAVAAGTVAAGFKPAFPSGLEALEKGLPNLLHAIGIVRHFGVTPVVAINRFPTDTPEELAAVKKAALAAGAVAVAESDVFARGGAGGEALAEAVLAACKGEAPPARLCYPSDAPFKDKVEAVAKNIYHAGSVVWRKPALDALKRFTAQGWDKLPVCIAKTHLSISSDPKLLGAPSGHELVLTDLRASPGAGFLYALAGEINTLPGLPKKPNALGIDLDAEGNVTGLR